MTSVSPSSPCSFLVPWVIDNDLNILNMHVRTDFSDRAHA